MTDEHDIASLIDRLAVARKPKDDELMHQEREAEAERRREDEQKAARAKRGKAGLYALLYWRGHGAGARVLSEMRRRGLRQLRLTPLDVGESECILDVQGAFEFRIFAKQFSQTYIMQNEAQIETMPHLWGSNLATALMDALGNGSMARNIARNLREDLEREGVKL